eukprot:SAG25_NODE_10_length_28450_cov_12.738775_18_plen_119_part_00
MVTTVSKKSVAGIAFVGYGAHADLYPTPYLTAAAAIGMQMGEVDIFVQRLQTTIDEFKRLGGSTIDRANIASAASTAATAQDDQEQAEANKEKEAAALAEQSPSITKTAASAEDLIPK